MKEFYQFRWKTSSFGQFSLMILASERVSSFLNKRCGEFRLFRKEPLKLVGNQLTCMINCLMKSRLKNIMS